MKKFRFELETVLSYKRQVLDALQVEHAAALIELRKQQELIETLWASYKAYSEEYRTRCAEGLDIRDVLAYQAGLRAREREIQQETDRLAELRKKEEAKRSEVVEAKQDTSSIEKLREKKLENYKAAISKSEEQFIEEFVSSRRCAMIAM